MFSVSKFYDDAHSGNKVDVNEFCEYLRSFNDIIIWGAGNLGTAVGGKLLSLGVKISLYWDAKWQEKKDVLGIPVRAYGEGNFKKAESIVLFCIANVPVSPVLYRNLIHDGWKYTIPGLAILEGILCPFSKETHIDSSICTKMEICTVCNCQRLSNITKVQIAKKKNIAPEDVLAFDRVHFIVNNFCNLQCTHCFMYMNSYPSDKKRNVSLEVMKRDIAMVLAAVDSFGVINVFGGEPFLHPHICDIVEELLKYDSYGSIIVNTNGIKEITDAQLEKLKNSKIRLAFSNYTKALSDKKIEKFQHNIERARAHGVTVGVQNELPTWNVSSTLNENHVTVEEKKYYKDTCNVKFLYVHNEKLFPCAFCLSINDLGIADYPNDYIDISKCKDVADLRNKILVMLNREYYCSCEHCDHSSPGDPHSLTNIAGQQGFDDRYALPTKSN